ncbi:MULTISPECIES: helix-turn-helix domain-containing protein [unclassified Bradyrhizobium]
MPWRESCAMDQRVSFIADQRSGMWTMTELCERYEISRKTGYKWLDRYQMEGPGGLTDRSHAGAGAWASDAAAHRGCDCGAAA